MDTIRIQEHVHFAPVYAFLVNHHQSVFNAQSHTHCKWVVVCAMQANLKMEINASNAVTVALNVRK
jgi:hypothetical protein